MITKEQALGLGYGDYIHYNGCKVEIGTRGGKKFKVEKYRVASQIKTWATRPNDWMLTVKWGMKPQTYAVGTVGGYNAQDFHLASECEIEELRY